MLDCCASTKVNRSIGPVHMRIMASYEYMTRDPLTIQACNIRIGRNSSL